MSAPRRRRLSRRAFLATAGGLTIGVGAGAAGGLLWPRSVQTGQIVNAFVALLADGRLEFVCPAQDLGQGAPLALTMILAAEIGADPARIAVIPAPRDAGRYGNPDFASRMVTADSKTTRGYWPVLRLAGAEARGALIATACAMRGWREDDCALREHGVHHISGAALPLEAIAAAWRLRMPGRRVALRAGTDLPLLGTSPDDARMRDIVTGAKRFGSDLRAKDTLVAVVARSPHLDGKPLRVDEAAARAVPGVEAIVPLADGVAVVARHLWAALKGRAALSIAWSAPGDFGSAAEEARMTAALDDPAMPAVTLREIGRDLEEPTLTGVFHAPALKHVILEPLNASARATTMGLGVIVSGSTQSPDLDMRYAARSWKTAPPLVEVTAQPSGGAYGRRVLNDAVRDACVLAKAIGKPVQVIRPMLDELQRGQVRPPAVQRIAATLAPDGSLKAWRHDIASDGTLAHHLPSSLKGANGTEDNTATDGVYHPYRVPDERIRWTRVASPLDPGFLRGVSAGYTVWAIETMAERLARAAGEDPLDWRLRHIDDARLTQVATRAAEMAGWRGRGARANGMGMGMGKGMGMGMGLMSFRGSAVACVAEVANGAVRGLWLAVDAGRIIHRDNVLAQIEGGAVWGLSMALVEQVRHADGRALVDTLAEYPILGADRLPPITIALLDGPAEAEPCGVGEIGVPTIIPAVCNAFEAATGCRFDRLPLAVAGACAA